MGCASSSDRARRLEPPFRPPSKPIQSGYFLYSDGHFKFKKVFAILFQDSTMAWFEKPKDKYAIFNLELKSVCHMMLVGPVCKRIPSCPQKIPNKTSYSYMIAFPQWESRQLSTPVFFFLCPNGNSMGAWMKSISETLPPPHYGGSPQPTNPPLPGGQYPPPGEQYPPEYPPQAYNVVSHWQQQTRQQQIQNRKSARNLTKGFLIGTTLGYGYRRPWGWGWWWGYGYHPLYGWGYFEYDMDIDVDVDVDVNYDISDFGDSDCQDDDAQESEDVGDADGGDGDSADDGGGGIDVGGGEGVFKRR